MRSALMIRDGEKSSVIVPAVEQPWLPRLRHGDTVAMPIAYEGAGYLVVRITGCCYHQRIAQIPECELGHERAGIDPGSDWHTILCKAQWGGVEPVSTDVIAERGAQGWFVIDFDLVGVPKHWRQRSTAAASA